MQRSVGICDPVINFSSAFTYDDASNKAAVQTIETSFTADHEEEFFADLGRLLYLLQITEGNDSWVKR